MKRRAIPWATALFFLTALSCDKDRPDPDCKDASCCHPEFNEYVEYIIDVPAHLSGPPQYSTWALRTKSWYPSGRDHPFISEILGICENSMDKIKEFSPEMVPSDSTQLSYNYRVSGKILSDEVNPRILIRPVLYIYIDKIEKIKP